MLFELQDFKEFHFRYLKGMIVCCMSYLLVREVLALKGVKRNYLHQILKMNYSLSYSFFDIYTYTNHFNDVHKMWLVWQGILQFYHGK